MSFSSEGVGLPAWLNRWQQEMNTMVSSVDDVMFSHNGMRRRVGFVEFASGATWVRRSCCLRLQTVCKRLHDIIVYAHISILWYIIIEVPKFGHMPCMLPTPLSVNGKTHRRMSVFQLAGNSRRSYGNLWSPVGPCFSVSELHCSPTHRFNDGVRRSLWRPLS